MSEEEKEQETETKESTMVKIKLPTGYSVELPTEEAHKFTGWMTDTRAGYKDLESKYQSSDKTIQELTEKNKLLSQKEFDYDAVKTELEGRIKSQYEEQIGSLKKKLIDTAVETAIASNESIVPDSLARADLKQLFVATAGDLSDDVEELKTKLSDFVKEKPHFLRGTETKAKPPVTKSKVASPTPQMSEKEHLDKVFGRV